MKFRIRGEGLDVVIMVILLLVLFIGSQLIPSLGRLSSIENSMYPSTPDEIWPEEFLNLNQEKVFLMEFLTLPYGINEVKQVLPLQKK